jgi:hypothetical protein
MNDENKFQSTWVAIGYISCLFAGIIGMFIGSFLVTAKKTMPDGRVVHVFNNRNRKHGKIILYLGCTVLILSILFFINWFILEKVLFGRPLR